MTQYRARLLSGLLVLLAGCVAAPPHDEATGDKSTPETVTRAVVDEGTNTPPRILAMGDSMMAWNSGGAQASIPEVISDELGEPVLSRAVSGAHIVYKLPLTGAAGLRIRNQYEEGDWDWVVLNGGGNDLWLGCGCSRCEKRMDRMISADGSSGDIPRMVAGIRETGARVLYLGYLRSPGVGSIIEHCRDEGDELERRLSLMAEHLDGVDFLSIARMVPSGDRSYHAADMIHPSVKGSREIGRRAARVIQGAPAPAGG